MPLVRLFMMFLVITSGVSKCKVLCVWYSNVYTVHARLVIAIFNSQSFIVIKY